MAEASTVTREVARTVYDEVTDIVLHLTYEEARVLRDLAWRVGGAVSGSRGHIGSISRALEKVGVNRSDNDTIATGTIYFQDGNNG